MNIEWRNPEELIPYEMNAKQHPPKQVEHIANSIKSFGWQQPIVCDSENVVIIGHGRLLAAKRLMLDKVPVVYARDLSEEQVNALRLADNKTNESEWDFGKLEEELAALDIAGIDMSEFGFDIETDSSADYEPAEEAKDSLRKRYLVPPFSIIYGNKPDWLARKRSWVAFGIRSEIGRGGVLCFNSPDGWQDKHRLNSGGGYERSKAFKNNSRLNAYQRGRKRMQTV